MQDYFFKFYFFLVIFFYLVYEIKYIMLNNSILLFLAVFLLVLCTSMRGHAASAILRKFWNMRWYKSTDRMIEIENHKIDIIKIANVLLNVLPARS